MAHLKNNCLPNTSDGYHIQSILSFFLESFQIVSKVEPKLTTFLRSRKGLGLLLGLDKSILLKRLKFLEEKKKEKKKRWTQRLEKNPSQMQEQFSLKLFQTERQQNLVFAKKIIQLTHCAIGSISIQGLQFGWIGLNYTKQENLCFVCCKATESKPVKLEINCTVLLPTMVSAPWKDYLPERNQIY